MMNSMVYIESFMAEIGDGEQKGAKKNNLPDLAFVKPIIILGGKVHGTILILHGEQVFPIDEVLHL